MNEGIFEGNERVTMKTYLRVFCALLLLLSQFQMNGWATVVRTSPGAGVQGAPVPGVTVVPQAGITTLVNPASQGGITFSVLPGQTTLKPSIVSPRTAVGAGAVAPRTNPPAVGIAPALTLPKAVIPAASPAVGQSAGRIAPAATAVKTAAPAGASGAAAQAVTAQSTKKGGVLNSVRKFAASVASPNKSRGVSALSGSRRYFDGMAADEKGSDSKVPAATNLPARAVIEQAGRQDGAVAKGVTFRAFEDGGDIATFRPRTVMLLDIFEKPASKQTVSQIQSMIDQGIHVVFMTHRPHKGKNSAQSVLLSKLKVTKANPVIVVSRNGGRISRHSAGKTEQKIVADMGAFSAEDVSKFQEIKGRVDKALKIRGGTAEVRESEFTYSVRMPASVSNSRVDSVRSEMIKRYNSALRSAGLPYRMEANQDDPRAIITYSMPMRFSADRVMQALDQQFPGESLSEKADEVLLIADTKRWSKIGGAIEGSRELQDVRSEADLQAVLGAALDQSRLSPARVKLNTVKQYVDYFRPTKHFRETGESTRPKGKSSGHGKYQMEFAKFTGGLMYQLMSMLYESVFRGQDDVTSLKKLEAALSAMWKNPSRYGVYVDANLAKLMKTSTWKKMSEGYYMYARRYVRNFWFREFGDFTSAQQDVMENLVNLSTDRRANIPLRLRSAFTGKLYKIDIRPPRVMKLDTADGRMLTAYAYRTGKETPGPGDELHAKVLALATLVGYGRKGMDQAWHHGTPLGPQLTRIEVQFEYLNSHRSWSFTPDELFEVLEDGRIAQGKIAQEVVKDIEESYADVSYQREMAKENGRAAQEEEDKPDTVTMREVRKHFGGEANPARTYKSEGRQEKPATQARTRKSRTLKSKLGQTVGELKADGSDLSTAYPRVAFILDIFKGPASDATAEYVQELVKAGVRVVFMTWRPQKGPDSADSVLLDRVKAGRTNPVIVVSHNGGRIALHSRAKNPTAIVPDQNAFSESDIETFRSINAELAAAYGIEEALDEHAAPDIKSAFSYMLRVPGKISRTEFMGKYNRALAKAKLPYKMTAHPTDARVIMTQSMPLRFSLKRVYTALSTQFRGEGLPGRPDKFLILSDSQRSPQFSRSFPKQAEVVVAKTGKDVEDTLGAVLGDRKLKMVSIKLGKLRQYVEYWEPSQGWRDAMKGKKSAKGTGGGSAMKGQANRLYHQKFAMFTGSVFFTLMAWFYEQVWRGQAKLTTQSAFEARFQQVWNNPWKYGVFISKAQAEMMKTPLWKKMSRGYFRYARAYLRNFYQREFGDYQEASEDVLMNLVSLASDRKSLITLNFKSPTTAKRYKIFTRIPRLMKHDTPEGRVLTAHAYRTGKEAPDDGDEIYAKTMALSTLVGYARKGIDKRWHHGWFLGKPIAKIQVRFEYRNSARDWWFDPNELLELQDNGAVTQGPIVQEITSVIERMEADEEYQEYYREQQERGKKEDAKKDAKAPAKGAKGQPAKKAKGRKGGAK